MAYPTNWAQFILNGPADVQHGDRFCYTCFHFTWSGPLPLAFDIYQFHADVRNWLSFWFVGLTYARTFQQAPANVHVNLPTGLQSIWNYYRVIDAFAPADVFPLNYCLVLRLFAAGTSRRDRGRKFLSGLPKFAVVDGLVQGIGSLYIPALLFFYSPTFVSQGMTFQHVIPSWADDTAKPVVSVDFSRIPGNINRRKKNKTPPLSPPPFPLPP